MTSLLSVILKFVEDIERMRGDRGMDKEACLDSMRGWTCTLIERFISEPYCTSFTLPLPSDLVPDEVISAATEKELARQMDDAARRAVVVEDI
jgi:hypothetical protein